MQEDHPVFIHNLCPRGCGMTKADAINNPSLSCQCGWPDELCEDEEEDFHPCSNCDGHDACYDFGCAIKAGIPVKSDKLNW